VIIEALQRQGEVSLGLITSNNHLCERNN